MAQNKFFNLKKCLINYNLLFLYGLLFYAFVNLDIFNSLSIFFVRQFNASQISYISSLGLYSNLIILIIFGAALDRFNTITILKIILIIHILFTFAYGIYPNIFFLTSYRIISGFLVGLAFCGCMRLAGIHSSNHIGSITGLFGLAAMSAGVFAQNPIIMLINNFGISYTFIILAVFGVIILICSFNTNFYFQRINKISYMQPIIMAIKNKNNWICALFVSTLNIPIFLMGDLWGNLYLTHVYGINTASAATIISMLFIDHFTGSIIFGAISDLFQIRKSILVGSSMLAVSALIILLIRSTNNSVILSIIFLFLGFASGSQVIAYAYTAITNSDNASASSIIILSIMTVLLGGFTQTISGNLIGDLYTDFYKFIIIILFCSIISLITATFTKFKKCL